MEYKFKANEFEGPLDLLLHLVKQSEMDIMDIEIVKLTDQYLEYINTMEKFNLNLASEYLVLAANLTYLKSRALLPKQEVEEEVEDGFFETKEELEQRLLEYKRYKEVTSAFKVLEDARSDIHTKTPSSLREYKGENITLSDDITINDLVEAFKKYLERKEINKTIKTKVTTKEISIKERRNSIRNILKEKKRVEFFDLFEDFSKPYVVVTFLSVLEMAKERELVIKQENNFEKIYCEAI